MTFNNSGNTSQGSYQLWVPVSSVSKTFITEKIIELIKRKKIGWQVIDCYENWLKDKKEWKDATMSWDISTEKRTTEIRFTHFGLVPEIECYHGCESARELMQNRKFIQINKRKKVRTALI